MSIALVTGSTGLIGSETVRFFCEKGFDVVGLDNDMNARLFGVDATNEWMRDLLEKKFRNYRHYACDIRDKEAVTGLFRKYGLDISLVVHAAAQPSRALSAEMPETDFSINATGTHVMLEAVRNHAPDAVFIFTSTTDVYGDWTDSLPLRKLPTRYEVECDSGWHYGIDETVSMDRSMKSLFGATKAAADMLVQEYGMCFGLKTVCFRSGSVAGLGHSGLKHHGFLPRMVRSITAGKKFVVSGFMGKQVRDIMHALDLVSAFFHFYENPRPAEVYNIGGGRDNSVSLIEAIELCQSITGRKLMTEYAQSGVKTKAWWITSAEKFKRHYPLWERLHTTELIVRELFEAEKALLRWQSLASMQGMR